MTTLPDLAKEPFPLPVAAVIGVVMRTDDVLLIRRANPPDAGCWGLPGGKIHKGEPMMDAIVREVREETGVTVTARRVFTAVDAFDIRDGGTLHQHFILIAVLCDWIAGEPVAGDDARDARWFSRPERERADLPLSRDVLEIIARAQSLG